MGHERHKEALFGGALFGSLLGYRMTSLSIPDTYAGLERYFPAINIPAVALSSPASLDNATETRGCADTRANAALSAPGATFRVALAPPGNSGS